MNLEEWLGVATAAGAIIAAGATIAATVAAWKSAKASAEAASTARRDIEERSLPQIAATFARYEAGGEYGLSDLSIEISNYGGLASNVRLSVPHLISGRFWKDESKNSVFADISRVSAFKHGIDVLRPGEVVRLPIGRFSERDIAKQAEDSGLDEIFSEVQQENIKFSMTITYDHGSLTELSSNVVLSLDNTLLFRVDSKG